MLFKPFRGLRPRPDLASKVPSLPYDVPTTEEARRLARNDPYSFLHVIRPEVDLDPGIDPHDERVYAKARENLRAMIDRGWLVRDEAPAYYVYRLTAGDHSQTGIVGAAAVEDYREDRIKKHEHTRPAKERDRVRIVEALAAHPGPVFLTYRAMDRLDAVVEAVTAAKPEVAFEAEEGIGHELWIVDDADRRGEIERLFREVPCSYVADGHHRAAAASKAEAPSGGEAGRYFLAVHFPADQLRILDYNRVVRDLNGLTVESFVERLAGAGFDVKRGHDAKRPPHRGSFGMYLDGSWSLLTLRPESVTATDVVARLDVAILADRVLGPLLGIGDPRTDERIDFVGGSRGMEGLECRVDDGDAALAFALYPTSLDEVMQVADSGAVMPPKSTWFEPKLRSGMVVQSLDGDL